MAKGPFELFETDPAVETQQGIKIDYDTFYITVARAGGSNVKFEKAMALVAKRNSFKIENELFEGDDALKILIKVYAETVVLGWGSVEYGDGVVPDRDGKPLSFSVDSVVYLLEELPALFADVRRKATSLALFRKSVLAVDSKN